METQISRSDHFEDIEWTLRNGRVPKFQAAKVELAELLAEADEVRKLMRWALE